MFKFAVVLSFFCVVGICNEPNLRDKLTIITSTSALRSHPSTELLEITQSSLFKMPGIKSCRKIIVFDGLHRRQRPLAEKYEQYKESVIELTKTNPYFADTKLVFCKKHKHLAWALQEAMEHVETPYVFVHQHDFQIKRQIDVAGIVRSMDENANLKHIRLPRRWNVAFRFDYHVDDVIEGPAYVPLTRTFGWSDNDHFTRKDYYDNFIFPKITKPWPMESFIHPLEEEMTKKDPKNHRIFGTYLYGKLGDGRYIFHLDGKRWKL